MYQRLGENLVNPNPRANMQFNNLMNQITQSQMMLLQQQNQNIDFNLLNALYQQQLQQQHQQQILNARNARNAFSSSFSVNSLLNGDSNEKLLANQQYQQQQLAAAVAGAILNTRNQNNKIMPQRQLETNDSAFQQPSKKRMKLNDNSTLSSGQDISNNNQLNSSICSISSPLSSSSSITDYDHHDAPSIRESPEPGIISSCSSNSSVDYNSSSSIYSNSSSKSSLIKRSNRKRVSNQTDAIIESSFNCPICGLSLSLNEIDSHLELELDDLDSFKSSLCSFSKKRKSQREQQLNNKNESEDISNAEIEKECEIENNKSRYLNYLRIKRNRQSRLNNKLRSKESIKENNNLAENTNSNTSSTGVITWSSNSTNASQLTSSPVLNNHQNSQQQY